MIISPRSIRTASFGPSPPSYVPKVRLREAPQTARASTRRSLDFEPDNAFLQLQSSIDKEIDRLNQFEENCVTHLRQYILDLTSELQRASSELIHDIQMKCEVLRTTATKLRTEAQDSEAAMRKTKDLVDGNDGKIFLLASKFALQRLDLKAATQVTIESKFDSCAVPVLVQDLASPEYRRLKPLANYYDRNFASFTKELQDLYSHILRTDTCKCIKLATTLQDQDVTHLCTLLEHSIGVREISLDGKGIGLRGGMHLSKAFPVLTSLIVLNLRSNDLGDEGVRWVAVGLPKLVKLVQLFLSSNNIGVEGAMHLARSLGQVPRLRELSLSSNRVGSKGALFLFESLPDMHELTSLNLSGNNIGHEGVLALLNVISKTPKLKKVFIGNNDLGEEGKKLLGRIPGIRVFH